MSKFADLPTDPSHVIGLYSDLLPWEFRARIQYPREVEEFRGCDRENALGALIDYLTVVSLCCTEYYVSINIVFWYYIITVILCIYSLCNCCNRKGRSSQSWIRMRKRFIQSLLLKEVKL